MDQIINIKIDDYTCFTKPEVDAYNAYQKHGTYQKAADKLGKDKSTVYRQVQKFQDKVQESKSIIDQIDN